MLGRSERYRRFRNFLVRSFADLKYFPDAQFPTNQIQHFYASFKRRSGHYDCYFPLSALAVLRV